MKQSTTWVLAAMASAVLCAGPTGDSRAEVALQAAMKKEAVDGDLKGAIDQYKKLAQSKDRGVAARALVRMGQCYDKLGDVEARKAYERVVREFGDQKEAVAEARKHLAGQNHAVESGIVARMIGAIPAGGSYMGPVSNDGRYVAFTTGPGVFMHDLVTGQRRQLASSRTPQEALFAARISPDGKQVAYERFPNAPGTPGWMCEIHIIGVDGSNPRHLAGSKEMRAEVSAWSADGRHVLALRDSKPDEPAGERVLINVADGSSRVIGSGRMREARFSPDGEHIAFTKRRGKGEGSDIALFSTKGGGDIMVVENHGQANNPVWTPDGKKLLFVSNHRNGISDMWSVRVERGRPLGPPVFVKERIDRIVDITRAGDCYFRAGVYSGDLQIHTNQLWVVKNLFVEGSTSQ